MPDGAVKKKGGHKEVLTVALAMDVGRVNSQYTCRWGHITYQVSASKGKGMRNEKKIQPAAPVSVPRTFAVFSSRLVFWRGRRKVRRGAQGCQCGESARTQARVGGSHLLFLFFFLVQDFVLFASGTDI